MTENTPLTPQEVADILKISKSTVYEMIKRKEINSYRVGKKLRVDLQDVEDYKNRTKEMKPANPVNTAAAPSVNQMVAGESFPIHFVPPREFMGRAGSFVISGQDVILDILCRFLDRHPHGTRALRSYEGSYNGLYALYRGDIQIATAHIWDSQSGIYNVPFVERMLPGIPAIVVRLASRMQGFYVAKGNPKNIKGWEDFRRSDIVLVNREKGSGTRILLDQHLRRLGIPGSSIQGYQRECQSHLTVAGTVARGGADVGIGSEKAGLQVQEIEFIPMQKEDYDMVIKKEDMRKTSFEAILDIVRSEEFKLEISAIGGYDLTETGKIVAET